MAKIKKTIALLKGIINDPVCEKMNRSNIKGYLGELLVRSKLEQEKCEVLPKGNQSGYDLEFDDIRIDVKTSTYKEEMADFPRYWGWALRHENKKRGISCTHFVCVALNPDLSVKNYYVINAKLVKEFPGGFKQFRNVVNGFGILPCRLPKGCDAKVGKFFKNSGLLLKRGKVKKIGASKNLRRALERVC
jgi:hypothetical protein